MAKEKTYSEKLRDPRWQKKRLEVLQRDNFTCVKCEDSTTELHIHHLEYRGFIDPWEYELGEMETLCKVCHSKEHEEISEVNEPERKYQHLLVYQNCSSNLTAIQTHMDMLMTKLATGVGIELETEILKNIMFLRERRKEYLNGNI